MLIKNNALAKVSENAISIEIPDTVTEISDDALNGCKKLEKIKYKNKTYTLSNKSDLIAAIHGEEGLTIENGVLTKVSPELTEVKIPDRVTVIESSAFGNCNNLTSVTIPNSVITIGNYAFSGCTSLTNITIPDNVTTIESGVFNDCTSLTSVTLPNSVTTIGNYAFYDCTSLKSITIPDSVTTIYAEAFSGCKNLTT